MYCMSESCLKHIWCKMDLEVLGEHKSNMRLREMRNVKCRVPTIIGMPFLTKKLLPVQIHLNALAFHTYRNTLGMFLISWAPTTLSFHLPQAKERAFLHPSIPKMCSWCEQAWEQLAGNDSNKFTLLATSTHKHPVPLQVEHVTTDPIQDPVQNENRMLLLQKLFKNSKTVTEERPIDLLRALGSMHIKPALYIASQSEVMKSWRPDSVQKESPAQKSVSFLNY
jgi:hypothetical protein